MKISVITAPEHKYFSPKTFKVFLAGGIQKCENWQEMTSDYLCKQVFEVRHGYDEICIMNPRRAEWLPDDSAEKQIEWEFDMLEKMDLFAMYFDGSESDQPICQYELGRYIMRMKIRFPESWENRIVITCNKNYKRLFDVITQVRLATDGKVDVGVYEINPIEKHYKEIEKTIKAFV